MLNPPSPSRPVPCANHLADDCHGRYRSLLCPGGSAAPAGLIVRRELLIVSIFLHHIHEGLAAGVPFGAALTGMRMPAIVLTPQSFPKSMQRVCRRQQALFLSALSIIPGYIHMHQFDQHIGFALQGEHEAFPRL